MNLILFFFFTSFAVQAQADLQPLTWPTYQGNSAHTGYAPITLDPKEFHPAWQQMLLSEPEIDWKVNPPIATEDSVYVSLGTISLSTNAGAQYIFSYNTANGKANWVNKYNAYTSIDGPTIDNGVLYFRSSTTVDSTIFSVLNACDSNSGRIIC